MTCMRGELKSSLTGQQAGQLCMDMPALLLQRPFNHAAGLPSIAGGSRVALLVTPAFDWTTQSWSEPRPTSELQL